MKKKILILVSFVLSIFVLTGCDLSTVDSIEVVGQIQTEYELDETLNLADITLRVWEGSSSYEINGTNSLLKITGFDTSTAGNKTMTLRYEGARLSIEYVVLSAATSAANKLDLEGFIRDQISPIRLVNTSAIEDITITNNYPLVIRGSGVTELAGVTINGSGNVTFQNVVLSNVTVSSTVSVSLENCKVIAEGFTDNNDGINITASNVKLNISNSTFETAGELDCFNYLVKRTLSTTGVEVTVKDTTMVCNFFYGISIEDVFVMDNCTMESTLKDDTPLKDGYGASLYNPNKNPVALHCYSSGTAVNYNIKNSTFGNVQNLLRCYNFDTIDNANFNLVWNNNSYSGVNYVINSSRISHATIGRTATALGVSIDEITTRYVAQNNTALVKVGEVTSRIDGTYVIYTGLQFVNKDNQVYEYVAFDTVKKSHYVKLGNQYYILKTAYSSDGLDTRTLTAVDNL